jgi:hypothetical protein
MWSNFNHPGGFGRKYRYRDNALSRLPCWILQPSKYAPKGVGVMDCGPIRWRSNRTGDVLASATWRLNHDGLERRFFITPVGFKRSAEQAISMVPDFIAKTNNLRWWWKCPDCGRRCGVLFLIPATGLFTCRKCGRVTYASQQEASPGRVFARIGIAWPKGARWAKS